MKALEFVNNMAASGATLMRGIRARPAAIKPAQPLALYEMEGCPYCRVVRETLTLLDLDAMIFPCPRGGLVYRPLARELGGKEQFPFLVDPNTGVRLYESADIVEYLYTTYAARPAPSYRRLKAIDTTTSFAASVLRAGRGLRAKPALRPAKPLELWSFEGSPFARPVREWLCEHEVPYLLHSVGRTQWQDYVPPPLRERLLPGYRPQEANRADLQLRAGRVQVPYLFDPNTGEGMFESSDILAYLARNYTEA